MAWNRVGPPNAATMANPSGMVSGAPSLGGMNETYRPGAFYNYMGLPHGTTRTYMQPADASPTKKMQQLKDLLDQDLIDQSDFDVQKSAILASIVQTGGAKPKMRTGGGSSMGQTSAQAAYTPPAAAKPTMGYSQFAYQPAPAPAPAPYASPERVAGGGADDALVSFMEASPVKMKAPEQPSGADPWEQPAAIGGPHGVTIDVPLASSDDALDGFIGAADMGSPTPKPSGGGGGGWSSGNTAAAVRLQGEFGAAGPQDLPPRAGNDPRASISMPELAREPAMGGFGGGGGGGGGGGPGGDPRVGGGFGGGHGGGGGLGFGDAAQSPTSNAGGGDGSNLWGFGRTERKELPTISGLDVEKALTLIRDKIRGRLEGGPSELRRAFQFFDADGSGSIDHEEMRKGLRIRTNLEFSDQMVSEIMSKFDEGTGEIDFNKFSKLVMGSSKDDRTGWTSPTKGGKNLGFDHFMLNEKNFMVNIKRQLKKQWKQVKTSFGHAGEYMSYDQVQEMFYLMNLDMADSQFKALMAEIDADGDGNLTYEEFMAFIRNAEIQHNTANMLPKIKDIPVEEAVLMIKEKILSQLASGKAATNLRRAFQAVDLDGSGTIEMDELSEVLRVKSSLDFEDGLMKRVFAYYDLEGTGSLNFRTFCERVMGESNSDATGFTTSTATTHAPDMDPRNFTKIVLRKIREQFKDVWIQMQHKDMRSTGSITADDLRSVFYRLNVVMPDQHFGELVANFADGQGGFQYKRFMAWVRTDF